MMMVVLVKWLIINIFQIPGRIWEYCLAKEKYNDDGGVSKVTDNELRKLTPPVK